MTSTSSAPTFSFSNNERVLCYHGPLIYEAKILKSDNFDANTVTTTGQIGPHYFVHYKGWKQTWDEWVPASRLLKLNEQNIAIQKAIQATNAPSASATSSSAKTHGKAGSSAKDGAGSGTRAGARKDGTRGTKRGRDEDESNKKPDIKLNVPEILKVQLVDDWEAVTKNNQLVTLPRSPSVVEILDEFATYMKSLKPPPSHLRDPAVIIPTIIQGLHIYFERSIGANLLYRFERPQYADVRRQYVTGPKVVVGQEKEMSAVYGAEHLLRMLVSLPQMISNSSLDAESATLVRDYVNELLLYMAKERAHLFQAEYQNASLSYQNVQRS